MNSILFISLINFINMSFSGEGVGSGGLEVSSEFPLAGPLDIFEHGESDFAVLK